MKYPNLIIKAASLLLVVGVLWQYQSVAARRASLVEERNDAVAQVEDYNAQILQQLNQEEESSGGYRDGTYEGTGTGFGGDITVSVSVRQGKIAEIQVRSSDGEDPAYFTQAETVLDEILESQSTQVDTVSGATYSSGGLIAAAEEALEKAVE